jgi:hypothetical protein
MSVDGEIPIREVYHLAKVIGLIHTTTGDSLGLCGQSLPCGGCPLRACSTAVRMLDPVFDVLGAFATFLLATRMSVAHKSSKITQWQHTSQESGFREGITIFGSDIDIKLEVLNIFRFI